VTPVIFRKDAFGVIAVFPSMPGCDEYEMTCYARIGQHSSCSSAWYRTTKPACASEFADLLKELKQIGYDDLKIVKRITQAHFDARKAAA
jgi:hypothetical protein